MRSVNVLRALARGCTACAILAAAGAAQAQINEDWSSGTENGWTTSSEQGFSTWVFDPFLGQWFGDDIAPPVSPNNLPESQYLTSPTFTMGADPGLEVEHWFDMENGFDGGVLEISVNGGPFTYVGGEYILAGQGYNGVISPNFQSHIMNQEAFTNISSAGAGVFITSSFYLADFAQPGDMVQIRFRLATDISVGDDGWYITRVSSVPLANPTGACCFLGGSCSDLTQVDCSAQGGTFMEGIACGVGLCPEGPRGDLCTDPIVIPSAPFIDSVTDLENYAGDPDIASCNSSTALEMNHAVWWSFAGTGERMRVSLRQVNMDAALAVFEGTDCGALTQLNCTDADMVNFDFDTVVGMTYYFVGMQWSSALLTDTNNTINIDLRVAPPPPHQ